MSNQRVFKGAAVLVVLSILILGMTSSVGATPEVDQNEIIEFSSFLGGTGDEHMDVSYAFGSTAVDTDGNIVVVGQTTSADFPVRNAFQENISGNSDGIICKFHPNGSMIFGTYFGGSAQEVIQSVVIDEGGNIIVAGTTGSSDIPLVDSIKSNTTGVTAGTVDGFVAKLSSDGQSLLFSTIYGGDGNDWLYSMNVDSQGRIAITGTTDSDDYPLVAAHQTTNAGGLDVFLALIDSNQSTVMFSTYLGTTAVDHGRRVMFDSQGDLILAGMAGNGSLTTNGAFQEEHGGGIADAFLAKFNETGAMEYLTFLGGDGTDWGCDLALDSQDNAVITGFTTSDDFPVLNGHQEERGGYADFFITKVSPDGGSIVFSTYLGGSSPDYGNAIRIDPQDRIIVTGQAKSDDFPVTLPMGTTDTMHNNVSLVVLNSDGSLLLSMVFGGEDDDVGIDVAWYSEDRYIIIGYTDSPDFPILEAEQVTYAGNSDMFVMRVDLAGLIDVPGGSNGFALGPVEIGLLIGISTIILLLVLVLRRRR